ncbi:MFS transporter [Histoplasma ohiense]|nr:MFS transporter [Histoplasma ohiense (nom. inval.)]
MPASSIQMQRLMSIVGATCVALACGTNYVYSAWAPQFAARLKLSSTDSNLIGAAGNLGMYASGIPVGLLIDSKGPRPGMLLGILALGAGYFPMHRAYVSGKGSFGVPALCFFMLLTGVGSSCGFSGAIKTAASNFPDHRGTSTSFPLAAFGLSAFFFSTLSAFAFSDNTGQFLLLLAICTPAILFVCSIFVRLIPHSAPYTPLPSDTNLHPSSSQLHIPGSRGSRCRDSTEIGMPHETSNSTTLEDTASGSAGCSKPAAPKLDQPETSSLIGRHLSPRTSEDSFRDEDASVSPGRDSLYADVRGWSMIPTVEFWQLFVLLGLFTGIGLMTINNIGNNAKALWKHYDDSADSEFIQKQQMMYVSVLSILSCVGRLLSGIGSDILVKNFHMSRFWCVFTSAVVFCLAQLAGFMISDPHHLVAISGLTGLAYGFLFGVFPSLVTHTFGVGGISQNWGVMCMSPVIWGNIFNLLYGRIYDSHSVALPNGELDCSEGLKCYRTSYIITFYAGIAGIAITLWTIWHEKKVFDRLHRKGFRD